jgi:hypothetical protein
MFKASFRTAKQKPIERCKFNNEKLLEPEISKAFNIELTNRFATLYEESPSTTQRKAEVNQFRADTLNKALIETSKTILGEQKKRKQPSWIRASTTALVEQQEQAKLNYKQAPTTSNKEI